MTTTSPLYRKDCNGILYCPAHSIYNDSEGSLFNAEVQRVLETARRAAGEALGRPSSSSSSTGSGFLEGITSSMRAMPSIDLSRRGVFLDMGSTTHVHQGGMVGRTRHDAEAEETERTERRRWQGGIAAAVALPILAYLLGKEGADCQEYDEQIAAINAFHSRVIAPAESHENGIANPHLRNIRTVVDTWRAMTVRILAQKKTTAYEKIAMLAGAVAVLAGAVFNSTPFMGAGTFVFLGALCARIYTWARSEGYQRVVQREATQIQNLTSQLEREKSRVEMRVSVEQVPETYRTHLSLSTCA